MDWSTSAVAALAATSGTQAASQAATASATAAPGFVGLFEKELVQMNSDMQAAEKALGDMAAGRPVELHEVMISLEKARISVQTFIQVRNKLVESYQDLMRMQM
ncbi:flagellar hook-basal body complex protein FliE [Aquabacterium sp. A7-Y]|uniref:flagellar hook-basal body complex protein FliE n=1 Tax=Aquabacterium sp. A7-Y TaxID=1349605 RepID=UPI00223E5AA6|nr:flagellar hook-basal body complex protein FliE [Aquabacterium sp. A7-Y]MCW7540876.1 flagellar hook-basal body complex protein FliE [Aquabacterium sp. A7-Y]